ncbi:MAG: TRAP transporter substrate-binding protein [Betaproteobacteria bacterium]|nr:TRAP transporter substrate-binding protein [Betaproteobacteria bacterium]
MLAARHTVRSILSVGALALAASQSIAADFTMKIGFGTMNDIQHQWANWYKESLEARTGKRIEVHIFPRSQLGTIASQIEGMQLGTVEALTSPTDFYAGVDPRFGTFAIPVLFKDAKHAEKVVLDAEMNKEIQTLGADKGLQVVSVFPYAAAHYFGKQPMRRLDDFKGKKLRVNATAAERAKMRQFGASAVPMELSEVVPGLQQGVIDGTMSAAAVYVNLKFIDIGKVILQTNDTMIISVGTVSRPWLNKLPADLRQAVIEEGNKLSGRTALQSHVIDEGARKRWQEAGGEFVMLSADEQKRMQVLLAGVGEEVTKAVPAVNAFYKKMLATSQKY